MKPYLWLIIKNAGKAEKFNKLSISAGRDSYHKSDELSQPSAAIGILKIYGGQIFRSTGLDGLYPRLKRAH